MHGAWPLARIDLIVMDTPQGELLLHDSALGHFHTLNATAASVWRLCDGRHSANDIAAASGLDRAVAGLALDQLADLGLLAVSPAPSGLTRRDVVRRLAAAGAIGAIALPVIGSTTAGAVGAGSACAGNANCDPPLRCINNVCAPCVGNGQACGNFNDCCSNFCSAGLCTTP